MAGGGCPVRQQLLVEFEAWNRTLNEIHEVELQALLADDLPICKDLQPMLGRARRFRDGIYQALQKHVREHGC